MKYFLFIILFQIHFSSNSQTINSNYISFSNSKFGISFNYPKSWEVGNPTISNTYWVGLPKYKSNGSVVVKIFPWNIKEDLKKYSKEKYKKDILGSSIYYKDLEFLEFDNQLNISGVDGIYSYYKLVGKYVDKNYYELLLQFFNNNHLYTTFSLYSIINHYGEYNGGHYISLINNK